MTFDLGELANGGAMIQVGLGRKTVFGRGGGGSGKSGVCGASVGWT
jgi:hypothetical protein